MKPAGIHHVSICVADADAGLAFYRDVLGLTQLPRPDLGPGYWLDAGGQQVHLMQSDEARPAVRPLRDPGRRPRRSRRRPRGHDVKVFTSDYIPGAGHQAFLHDPFGNFIELNQPDN